MSLAMGRLPAILVGQIPVVTTTDRGKRGKRTEDRGQRASRPEYGIENLSKFLGIVLPLGEKKKKGRKKKRKRKTTTLDRAPTFFFSSSPPPLREKNAASRKRPRRENYPRGISPYQESAAPFIGPYNGVISGIKRDR